VLKKGETFLQTNQDVSFPTFDFVSKTVYSRIQGPNDEFVTVNKLKWKFDELVLDTVLEIPQEEYRKKYGNLVETH
jgi:hypothetical protein